jgi:MFS family permease
VKKSRNFSLEMNGTELTVNGKEMTGMKKVLAIFFIVALVVFFLFAAGFGIAAICTGIFVSLALSVLASILFELLFYVGIHTVVGLLLGLVIGAITQTLFGVDTLSIPAWHVPELAFWKVGAILGAMIGIVRFYVKES